jgi:hypothetical protein
MAAFSFSIICAIGFGLAIQRGGLCIVSGITDVIEHHSLRIFLSFFRISFWAASITLPVSWLYAASHLPMVYAPAISAIAGGLIFGAGAATNGGCSFGTLIRLGAGDLSFIATFGGMAAGIWVQRHLFVSADPLPRGLSILAHPSKFGAAFLGLVAIFCLRELVLVFGRQTERRFAPENAAVAIGLTGGILYVLNGAWPYTVAFDQLINSGGADELHGAALAMITVATLAGAVCGALLNRTFRLRCLWHLLPLRIGGGVMMGFGAALIPGGNGVLILHSLPALSPNAVPAYLALVAGAGTALLASRSLRRIGHLRTSLARGV